MKYRSARGDAMMLIAAFIWGTTFVAQRRGMEYIGPFIFNALRFLIGATVVLLFKYLFRKRGFSIDKKHIEGGIVMGIVLFFAITFQQWGLVYTTAGKGGFITGLYVVFVPLVGSLLGKKTGIGHFVGAVLSFLGLYLLSVKTGFNIEKGDFLVFLGAIFWTMHVLLIDNYTTFGEPLTLSFIQFMTTFFLSLLLAGLFERIEYSMIEESILFVLYAGILSSGIAYTLQVVSQKFTHHAHAAIILSLESVFAALAGYVLLSEKFTIREIKGSILMILGMLVSQLYTSIWENQERTRYLTEHLR